MNRSRVAKRYDRATTRCERAIAKDEITRADLSNMHATMDAVRPGDLYRQIQTLTKQLERMALAKAPAPVKPRVQEGFQRAAVGGGST